MGRCDVRHTWERPKEAKFWLSLFVVLCIRSLSLSQVNIHILVNTNHPCSISPAASCDAMQDEPAEDTSTSQRSSKCIMLEENFIPNTIQTCVRIQRNFAVAKELSGGMEQSNRPTTQANDVPMSPLKFRTKLGQDILKWKLTSFGNHPTAASTKRKGRILSQQVSETQFMEVCEFRPVENTFQAFRC
jgi:hypothetical protein